MKCHYVFDKDAGKVLIPGCYQGIYIENISECICKEIPETFEQFEKKEYREKIKEKDSYIKQLEAEIISLNNKIGKLLEQ